jgi:hypothetical protein
MGGLVREMGGLVREMGGLVREMGVLVREMGGLVGSAPGFPNVLSVPAVAGVSAEVGQFFKLACCPCLLRYHIFKGNKVPLKYFFDS